MKQSVLALNLLLPLIFIAGLNSCEFDSDDKNFVIIEKPEEEITIGINLAGVNPEEWIYVYEHTEFSYSLYTEEKDIFLRQFFLDGVPIETDQYSGTCSLYITDNEVHELKLLIMLNTGTGSLAEYAGYEMFAGEFIFNIKRIPSSDKLNIRETTTQDKYLRLEWDKPTDYEVWGYEVYHGDFDFGKLLARITNPGETFFVDPDYTYGYKHYTIVAYVKNSFDMKVVDNISVNHTNMTEESFETRRISLKELNVTWDNPNPFPCKYVIEHDGEVIVTEMLNQATLTEKSFPGWGFFTLYILPESADIENYKQYPHVSGEYSDRKFESIHFQGDPINKMCHKLTETTIESYDLPTMKKISSTKHNLNISSKSEIQITKDGIFAINTSEGFVHLYSDYTLSHQINKLNTGYHSPWIVSDGMILIGERGGFKIRDIHTGAVLYSKIWQSERENGTVIPQITLSPDGKYMYVLCYDNHMIYPEKKWIELYELGEDHTLSLLETTDNKGITAIHFHPIRSTEAIMVYSLPDEDKFTIIDFLSKNKTDINGKFMHIDPFTGNLLFWGNEDQNRERMVYVLDHNYKHELIQMKPAKFFADGSKCFLFNNILFLDRHCQDLSLLKEWKQ